MRWCGQRCRFATSKLAMLECVEELIAVQLAVANAHECADEIANHLVEESIAAHRETPRAGRSRVLGEAKLAQLAERIDGNIALSTTRTVTKRGERVPPAEPHCGTRD